MSTGCKTCRKCGTSKLFAEFSHDAKNADGLNTACRACRSAVNKAWRASKNSDSVWPRDTSEVVIDKVMVAWRYPVSSARLAWRV